MTREKWIRKYRKHSRLQWRGRKGNKEREARKRKKEERKKKKKERKKKERKRKKRKEKKRKKERKKERRSFLSICGRAAPTKNDYDDDAARKKEKRESS